jgi:hypothetical protein
MMHTLTITGLDDFEATHIAEILYDYKTKMMSNRLDAFVEDRKDGGSRVEWYEKHLAWHESIMAKVKWTKNETSN